MENPLQKTDKMENTSPVIFTGYRTVKTGVMKIPYPPSKVFPLLCPQREYDWVPGWDCEMIYSESGYAEQGCIFKTKFPHEGDSIWIMTDYKPDHLIRIVKTAPDLFLLQWSLELTESSEGTTDLKMTYSMTGLSQTGNIFVRTFMDAGFGGLMDRLEKSMIYYLKTGQKLALAG